MRVALVIYGSLDTLSGGYLYDRMLVEHLRAHGHSVEVLSLPWRNYLRHLSDNLARAWLRRLRACKANVIVQDELNHPSLAFVNQRLDAKTRPPLVALVHHLRASEEHSAPLRPLYRAVERRYLRSVDGYIFNSRTTQATVQALAEHSAPSVVAFPSASHLRSALSLSLHEVSRAETLHLLAVGNLSPRKNLHTLLDALALLESPAHLHIVGSEEVDPAYARRLRAQVARLGLESRVTFHGRAADDLLARLYAACHLFVLPSWEGFGIVYLEAMAHGLPVIASTAGAAHEVVIHGETGYLVAPNDAATLAAHIATLHSQPELRASMAQAARKRYESFPTWEQSCSRITAFLQEMAR